MANINIPHKKYTEIVDGISHDYIDKVQEILQNKYADCEFKLPLKAHVHSYGCQQNVSDGEKIMGILVLLGYTFTNTPDDADIVIYNTCAVRENAEDRVYGNIGELKHNKKANPDMIIGLCGCMVQQEHIADKIKESYPQIDLVFGTHVLDRLPMFIYNVLTQKKRQVDLSKRDNILLENMPVVRDKSTKKANLPIMYGCNNFCAFCVVPYVRGREKSRKSQDIINEFTSLVEEGFKEITLLGQNVNSYGNGLDNELSFAQLLCELNKIDGDFRIRFMSSHPKDASFELIDAIASCEKVCNHFHLPIQSGSNRVLDVMNRRYTRESYLEIIKYARNKIPDIAFTSDIIVGFPSETKEDFNETVSLINEVKFDSIFSFIYSKRVGTKAYSMEDNISKEEKTKWFNELLLAQKKVGRQKYDNCIGNIYRVLVDGVGKTGDEYLTGRNDGFMIIDFIGNHELIGEFVQVKITKSLGWALIGEIILD